MQSVTEEVSRVISHQDFHQFIHGLISDSGPRFRSIVEESEAYSTTKATIQGHISQHFDDLSNAVKRFEACRDINAYQKDFNFEVWKKDHTDHEDIKVWLGTLQKWEQLIQKLGGQDKRGLIEVQGNKLRNTLSTWVKEEQVLFK
jgi:hypothetical protein